MTTQEIFGLLFNVEGAIETNVSKLDDPYMLALLDSGRNVWLVETYKNDKRLPPICYQKYYPTYSLDLQPTDKCFKKFLMPDIIRLDEHSDGIRYVGEDDYDDEGTNNFARVQSRAWLSNYKKHPVMNPNRYFSHLYDGSAGILELRGKARLVEKPLVEALFKHPLQIPTFNKEQDQYPLSLDGIYAVKGMITSNDTRLAEMTTPKPAFAPPQMIK